MITFKLKEHVSSDQHMLVASGDKQSGKTFMLDKIADAAPAWGFRVKVRSFFDENLTLIGTRRTPARVLPLIENSLAAWGFAIAPSNVQRAESSLRIQRRELPMFGH